MPGCAGRRVPSTTAGTGYHFFLHWPEGGLSTGRDVEEVTANVDILPTLIDLCGLEKFSSQGRFDGLSLKTAALAT